MRESILRATPPALIQICFQCFQLTRMRPRIMAVHINIGAGRVTTEKSTPSPRRAAMGRAGGEVSLPCSPRGASRNNPATRLQSKIYWHARCDTKAHNESRHVWSKHSWVGAFWDWSIDRNDVTMRSGSIWLLARLWKGAWPRAHCDLAETPPKAKNTAETSRRYAGGTGFPAPLSDKAAAKESPPYCFERQKTGRCSRRGSLRYACKEIRLVG
jgi:hypothetical protein